MGFEKGTSALTVLRLNEKLPENFLEKFNANNAGKFDSIKTDEVQRGWVSGRHLLENIVNENTALKAGYIFLNYRRAERKIPPTLLNAMCKMREIEELRENPTLITVSKKRKREIKNQIIEDNISMFAPSVSGVEMVIDPKTNLVFIGTASVKQVDQVLDYLRDTFSLEPGKIPSRLDPDEIMFRNFKEPASVLPNIHFTVKKLEDEHSPGRDFLTWLWFHSERNEGSLQYKNNRYHIAIEGPLLLALATEAQGAGETNLKKGCPTNSAEAKIALEMGKKLKKAKFRIARGQDVWSGTFEADKFTFSGLKLPDGEEMDPDSVFDERMLNLNLFCEIIEEYFKLFVSNINSPEWKNIMSDIQEWTEEKLSY